MVKFKQDLQQVDLNSNQFKKYCIKRSFIYFLVIFLLFIPVYCISLCDFKVFSAKKLIINSLICLLFCVTLFTVSYFTIKKFFKTYRKSQSYETEKEILVNEKGMFIKAMQKVLIRSILKMI